jgi:5-(carboxyamino)imidazole ribonucleotide mutase
MSWCYMIAYLDRSKSGINDLNRTEMEEQLQTTNYQPQTPQVGIIMGSDSDLPIMQAAADILKYFEIDCELTVVSAHRTPQRMFDYASSAAVRGLRVIIAGAGGAAHLPGMVASITTLPVIGVPIKSSNSIDGWDSVLSILQMPNGIPVATVALNGAKNAGILAANIIGAFDDSIMKKIVEYKQQLKDEVLAKVGKLKEGGWNNGFDS